MAQFNKNTHQFLGDSKTLFESVMLADQYGNIVNGANPTGMAIDAFGRSRVSNPVTLFESFNRYFDSDKFSNLTTTGGSTSYNINDGTTSLTVDTTATAKVTRETNRVFAYQPGKSLQVLCSFVMAPAVVGLTQRVGYYNDFNGIYLEQADTTANLVVRSYSSGAVTSDIASQANRNLDKLDGTGPSGYTLDLTKAQVLFIDVDWLGVGTVRCGFIINGELVHVHSFHHANLILTTYMTTACLPVRYEIFKTATTASSASMKTICTSVVSEGGYEVRGGRHRTIGQEPGSPKTLTTAGVYYPLVSLQVNPSTIDSIVVPRRISILPTSSGNFRYKLVSGATITGGAWTSPASTSTVQYNLTATSMTGGTDLTSGYISTTNQTTGIIQIDSGLFTYQLERNGLTGTPTTFTLAIQSSTAADTVCGSFDWQEIA